MIEARGAPQPIVAERSGRQRVDAEVAPETRGFRTRSGFHPSPFRVVSVFSGCGGMDLGFLGGFSFAGERYSRLSFEIVWANDISPPACTTYRTNLGHGIHQGDIVGLLDTLPETADVLIGGFPCQDVSINGSRRGANGTRTVLYRQMIEAIRLTQPAAFVAENVKGLLMSHARAFFDQMLADFQLPGYRVSHQVYLAADYGVPQMRERLFIIGVRGSRPFRHPQPRLTWRSCQDVLGDLESRPWDPATSHIWSRARKSPHQGNRKLVAQKPSTTIRAEHHGNSQWHYNRDRRISLREAARLQSFPDEFRFPCGMRETERQIGNAVPPVLAWHIATAIHGILD